MTHISPNAHEKAEWSRLAQAAYAVGYNAIGHRYSAASSIPDGWAMPVARFDKLQTDYRAWLIGGFPAMAESIQATRHAAVIRSVLA